MDGSIYFVLLLLAIKLFFFFFGGKQKGWGRINPDVATLASPHPAK